jgi:hypothetical protein
LVKVKFQNGNVMEIKKGIDNAFKCGCDKVFKHPLSLKKHAKECNDESTTVDNGLIDEDVSEEDVILDASESSDLDDNLVDDIPADCVGMICFVNGCNDSDINGYCQLKSVWISFLCYVLTSVFGTISRCFL